MIELDFLNENEDCLYASHKPNKNAFLLGLSVLVSMITVYALFQESNLQKITYRELSGPVPNPLMGWAPWATLKEISQPHTLVYADLTWRDFEPREGVYDFAAFEEKQQLARWRAEGKRVVFRFVLDAPGDEPHCDIPDWLFDKLQGNGDEYDNEYGKGFSPDYSNSMLIDYHEKVIQALGERYGNDGFFAFIELGSLGHWGEWHTHPGLPALPSEGIRDLYVQQYRRAFPGTHLLMRRPFGIAGRLGLGLYNDMTADPRETYTWLDWIGNGGEFLPGESSGLSPMPDDWQRAPIGGEQSPLLTDEDVYGRDLMQTIELLRRSHTTFIGPGGPYGEGAGGPLQGGIDQALETMGYRIHIDQARMPGWVLFGSSIKVEMTFSNTGIAPLYYNWPTGIFLLNGEGIPIYSRTIEIDWRQVLPAQTYEVSSAIPIDKLENGTYSIGIAILDPITGKPAIRFANENIRQDLVQYIGSFEVKRLFRFH